MVMKLFATLIVYLKRSLFYIQAVQFFLIFTIRFNNYDIWYQLLFLILIIIGSLTIGYMDMRLKILEKEQSIFNRENKELEHKITKEFHFWGWSTWADRWADWQEIGDYENISAQELVEYGIYFEKCKNGYDTWDWQWLYSILKNDGYAVSSTKNMVKNQSIPLITPYLHPSLLLPKFVLRTQSQSGFISFLASKHFPSFFPSPETNKYLGFICRKTSNTFRV